MKTNDEAQSEAPSVDSQIDEVFDWLLALYIDTDDAYMVEEMEEDRPIFRAKINRLIVEAQQEAIDYFAWRIDCSTVISELYGWKGCVDTAKDQTERHFELSNNLSKGKDNEG